MQINGKEKDATFAKNIIASAMGLILFPTFSIYGNLICALDQWNLRH